MSRVHLSRAESSAVEEEYVLDALRSGWVAPAGPHLTAFEEEVAALVGVAGGVAMSSGTAALHLALLDAGAAPGTVIPVSTLTFAATVNAVLYTGARPALVDSLSEDGNVDPALLVEAVDRLQAEGAHVPAVVVVDLFGTCADYASILEPMAERGVAVVEDAAEALGAGRGGRTAGAFGRSAVLSFNGNKILTTSGGGMLLSDDAEVLRRARHLATQAREPVAWYEHLEVGYNYRLSNILAALGRGQLRRFDALMGRRLEIRERYRAAFAEVPGVRLLGDRPSGPGDRSNCWLTTVVLDPSQIMASVATVLKDLEAQDIEARHVWKPMHLQPAYEGFPQFLNGTSQDLFETSVVLPSGSALSDGEVDRVIDALVRHLGRDRG